MHKYLVKLTHSVRLFTCKFMLLLMIFLELKIIFEKKLTKHFETISRIQGILVTAKSPQEFQITQ